MKDIKAIPLTLGAIKQYNIENHVIFGADYKQDRLNDNYSYEHDILALFLGPHTRSILNKHLVDTKHKAEKSLANFGSLLDDSNSQKEMIELGIDILFTDRPYILRQTLDSYLNK
ncbi:unnamed protein product [Rotaria sp. Silwood1]|nr:unnamed protein product [Rotaria sp. Silwood1]CAF4526962.1 unnamed protein product [Rotaria sp. Silwood1]